MKIFKNYKKLYETELKNRKVYEERYKQIYKNYVDLQQKSGMSKLRKENRQFKEQIAKLTFDLEDTQGFLEQEKCANKELINQRNEILTIIESKKTYTNDENGEVDGIKFKLKHEDIYKIYDILKNGNKLKGDK